MLYLLAYLFSFTFPAIFILYVFLYMSSYLCDVLSYLAFCLLSSTYSPYVLLLLRVYLHIFRW